MRARKILKITAITMASIALVLLFLVAFFLFNPFEGSLPQMRDIVPRGVDFFVQKANIRDDFTEGGSVDDFPYVPALQRIGQSSSWTQLKRGAWYKKLGIREQLATLEQEFKRMRKDMSFLHLVDDLIGEEVQVAGSFGDAGTEDATWCAYTRVSWRGKAAFGMLARSFVREEMAKQGLILTDDESGFYKLKVKASGADLFIARHLDCVMIANDRGILTDSLKLADGNVRDVEPLGRSSHYKDGVEKPLAEWRKLTGVESPNVLELHANARQMIPKLSFLQGWPDPNNDENRNEKILASFINKDSYRFLSGSLIFEPNSLTFLSHLVVNNNELTSFQKPLFTSDPTPRIEWMDAFFNMVPRDACAAAALKINPGAFIKEMFKDGLVKDERDIVNESIRKTRKYKSFEDLVTRLSINLESRVGIILRPNRRSDSTKKLFKVKFDSPFPQWAWVFWVKKGRRSKRVMNEPLKQLVKDINENRRAFFIEHAHKLALSKGGVRSDVAYEFAIPDISGTGSIAVATLGEYFIFGNSGPFIHRMVDALVEQRSRRTEPDFQEFVGEMPDAMNGVVFLWADKLAEVAQDFENFSKTAKGTYDPAYAYENRPRAEAKTFMKPKWRQYRTKARIPVDQRDAFDAEVDAALGTMWRTQKAKNTIADQATLQQFRYFTRTFRSAYLQMVLDEESLRVWGRILAPGYGR